VLYGENVEGDNNSNINAAANFNSEQQQQQQQQGSTAGEQKLSAAGLAAAISNNLPPGLGKFGSKLASVFLHFDCLQANSSENVANFCKTTEQTLKNPDDRLKLLHEVDKESHRQLRFDLLTGKLTLPQFMAMSAEELISPGEIAVRIELNEAIAFRAREGTMDLVGNELYECPKCHERNSVQKEVQIRSADEPATVFITCLSCKHNWSEN
jgi:DNA-directed RNA polymerase subunit M/transcription elongation factor TFIIS